MIYCGAVLVAVPASVKVPAPVPDLFSTGFQSKKKFVQNLAFSLLEATLFPRGWPLIFDFLNLYHIFC